MVLLSKISADLSPPPGAEGRTTRWLGVVEGATPGAIECVKISIRKGAWMGEDITDDGEGEPINETVHFDFLRCRALLKRGYRR